MSHPAAAAARASSTEPTCHDASAPPAWTVSTRLGSGSPQKKSTSGACAAATSTTSRSSRNGTRKFTPIGPGGSVASVASSRSAGCRTPLSMPFAPAWATATGSGGSDDTQPIGACWIGMRQPSSSVKRVGMTAA